MTTFSTIARDEEELEDLYQKVIENMKAKGLRSFAFPRLPHILEPYTEVEYEGKIYRANNLPPGVRLEDTSPLAPATMENVSDEVLEHLLVYWHARAAHVEGVIGEARTRRDIAKEAYTRYLEATMIELEGKQNPMTGKTYSDVARKEAARHSARVASAYERFFEAELQYQWAETQAKAIKSIPEMINRVRMTREQKLTRVPGGRSDDSYRPPVRRRG